MRAYIYTLAHPVTGEIRYVGKTNKPARRFWDHYGSKLHNYSGKWVRSLRAQGLRPVLEVLEELPDHKCDYEEAERFYIAYFRFLGMRLTNQESGGRSGKCHSAETKALQSRLAQGRKFPEGSQEKALAARMTPEGRANMSAAKKGHKRSQVSIEKHRAKMMGHSVPESTRRKLHLANKGVKPSESAIRGSIKKLEERAAAAGGWQNLSNLSGTMKGKHQTAEAKAAMGAKNSINMKRFWAQKKAAKLAAQSPVDNPTTK